MLKEKQKGGITLISLVITIVVLLILAGVAISIAIDSNGIFGRARYAADAWNKSMENEKTIIDNAFEILNEINVGGTEGVQITELTLSEGKISIEVGKTSQLTATINPPNATDKTITWRSENDQIATVEGSGTTATVTGVKAGTTNIVVAAGGKEVKCSVEVKANSMFTKENVKEYLGKVVTNFRPEETGETENVINSSGTYTVGTTYRLYYVDFDGKYGEKGTVYLKADCPEEGYELPLTDTTDVNSTKMKELNPSLYKDKEGSPIDPPDENYNNMKAVKWLLNPTNWNSLKESSPIKDSVNYVVGAPSLEMMMDSYNTYYNLTGTSPQTGSITAGERRKLFYQYTVGDYGYKVGPGNGGKDYYHYTEYNAVYTDGPDGIDEMYYPGDDHLYWLASPSANSSYYVMRVSCNSGGFVSNGPYDGHHAFCPLVSLDSSVQLEFAE